MKFTLKRASDYLDNDGEIVEINSIEELMDLCDKYDNDLIISRPNVYRLLPYITIYDACVE